MNAVGRRHSSHPPSATQWPGWCRRGLPVPHAPAVLLRLALPLTRPCWTWTPYQRHSRRPKASSRSASRPTRLQNPPIGLGKPLRSFRPSQTRARKAPRANRAPRASKIIPPMPRLVISFRQPPTWNCRTCDWPKRYYKTEWPSLPSFPKDAFVATPGRRSGDPAPGSVRTQPRPHSPAENVLGIPICRTNAMAAWHACTASGSWPALPMSQQSNALKSVRLESA